MLLLLVIITSVIIFFWYFDKPKSTSSKMQVSLLKSAASIVIGEEYQEPGIKLIVDDKDVSNLVEITNNIDNAKPGEYEVIYRYKGKVIKKRKVIVVDNIAPVLKLKGANTITMFVGGKYKEPGYTVIDNVDGDLLKNVKVTNNINNIKAGSYTVTYTVSDSANNVATLTRQIKVIVKPKAIIKKVVTEAKAPLPPKIVPTPGLVHNMRFNDNGISINGCVAIGDVPISLYLNDIKYTINVNNNCYSANINLSNLALDSYTWYIESQVAGKTLLINKIDSISRINRSKVGNLLASMNYANNNVVVSLTSFNYDYDILIDVGHGGTDTGAINTYIKERELNLKVSQYEKQRFEALGLRVKLSREDSSLGMLMGSTSWKIVTRRSYALGYYGTKARFIYSNHHNATTSSKTSGFEMLIPASQKSLTIQNNIKSGIRALDSNKPIRMYTRNYNTNAIFDKSAGQVYSFTNWYAVNRIPYELFNTYVTIYEGAYMSNVDEFIWYYHNDNWKKISEIKIKAYTEALGRTYIAP